MSGARWPEITARDDLQIKIGQLKTDNQDLESSLTWKWADLAETVKALSGATATEEAQDKRIEDFESQEDKEAADATKALQKAYDILKIDFGELESSAADYEETVEEYQSICEDLEQEVTQQKSGTQGSKLARTRRKIAELEREVADFVTDTAELEAQANMRKGK